MMNRININRRTLGVTFTDDQQAFIAVWAPRAKAVALSVNEHSFFLPLTKDNRGYWQLTTNQLKPGDTYTFVLDTEKEWADPASLLQPQGIYGASQAYDPTTFYWEDSSWVNPPIDEYIVYELDIHTFTEEGTLKAIIRKLNHIRKLGVNALLIRPVTDFPEASNRNQDAAFLFAVQASYGGPAQLQQLVNACHYEGLAVVLDLSYKQIDQPDHILNEPVGYGTQSQTARKQKNKINPIASREAYQHYLLDNALMWFRDFHVDALRLENINSIAEADQLLHAIRKNTNSLTAKTGRQHYLLVEQDLTLVSKEAKKSDDSHSHDQLNGMDSNCTQYYADSSQKRHRPKHYRKDCLCDSTFSTILQKLFDRQSITVSDNVFVTALQTNYFPEEQPDQRIDPEFIKLVAGSIMVSPCIPTLFMGEEWGITNPFHRIGPSELVPAEMGHESLLLAGIEAHPTSGLPWEMLEEQPSQILYKYYQALTALRRQQPALYHLNPNQAQVIYQQGEPTLLLRRSYKTNVVLCLMNFSREMQPITLPSSGKKWQKLLDSADPIWDGPGSSPQSLPDLATIMLHPESIVVYKAHD